MPQAYENEPEPPCPPSPPLPPPPPPPPPAKISAVARTNTTILLAEKVLKLVPSKTHNWDMYVQPEEILKVADTFRFKLDKIKGLAAIPSLQGFKWIRINNTKANYIISIIN